MTCVCPFVSMHVCVCVQAVGVDSTAVQCCAVGSTRLEWICRAFFSTGRTRRVARTPPSSASSNAASVCSVAADGTSTQVGP